MINCGNYSDEKRIDLMKSNRELAEVKNVRTALHYENGNRLAIAAEVELVHIISSRNQVDYNTEYDRKVFRDFADKLLEITISSYSVIEGEGL